MAASPSRTDDERTLLSTDRSRYGSGRSGTVPPSTARPARLAPDRMRRSAWAWNVAVDRRPTAGARDEAAHVPLPHSEQGLLLISETCWSTAGRSPVGQR